MTIHHRDIATKESEGVASWCCVLLVLQSYCCRCRCPLPLPLPWMVVLLLLWLPHAIHFQREEQLQLPLHDAAVSSCNLQRSRP